MASRKQKHAMRQRVREKLAEIDSQKDVLVSLIEGFISTVKERAMQLLCVEDRNQSIQHYMDIMQDLERCFNMCITLEASAEELLEKKENSKGLAVRFLNAESESNTIVERPENEQFYMCSSQVTESPTSFLSKDVHSKPVSIESKHSSFLTQTLPVSEDTYGMGPKFQSLFLASTMTVMISEVQTPYCFWIHIPNALSQEITKLSDNIRNFIRFGHPKTIRQPVGGMSCLAQFSQDKEFYRAQIIKVKRQTVKDVESYQCGVKVLYVDFGNMETIPKNRLRQLPAHLAELPAQAICCALAKVAPVELHGGWSSLVINYFQKLINVELVCIPLKSDTNQSLPQFVHLLIVTAERQIAHCCEQIPELYGVSALLVEYGFAKHASLTEQLGLMEANSFDHLYMSCFQNSTRSLSKSLFKQDFQPVSTKSYSNRASVLKDSALNQTVFPSRLGILNMNNCEKLCRSSSTIDSMNRSNVLHSQMIMETTPYSRSESFKSKKNKDVDHYLMMAHIESPTEFYAHLVSMQTVQFLNILMSQLNAEFQHKSKQQLKELSRHFFAEKGKLCCAYYSKDKKFYRSLVLMTEQQHKKKLAKVSTAMLTIQVLYIDFGNKEWLSPEKLFPLSSSVCNIPPLAVCCSLAYLKPLITHDLTNENKSVSWPEESISAFRSATGYTKKFFMKIVSGYLSSERPSEKLLSRLPLQVLLFDVSGEEEVCINFDLVYQKLAAIEPCLKTSDPDNLMMDDSWNPMRDDFTSKTNNYKWDVDDAGIAIAGFKAQDEQTVCRYYRNGYRCWREDRCPYRHVQVPTERLTVDKSTTFGGMELVNQFPLPNPGDMVGVEVSAIMNPSHFYVVLPWGQEKIELLQNASAEREYEMLSDLQRSLQCHYKKCTAVDEGFVHLAWGELVVARYSCDGAWYRANVCEVDDEEEKVKVFFVDFGNTEWINEDEIHPIEPQFTHLPFQAVECFLADIKSVGGTWTQEAQDLFWKLVDGKVLVALVKSRTWIGQLCLELFDTSLDQDVNIGEVLIRAGHAVKETSKTAQQLQADPTNQIAAIFLPG